MTKLYGVSDNHRVVAEELAEIKVKHDEEMLHAATTRYIDMFTGPRMAYRIALGVTLQMLQQLTGANYFCKFLFYLPLRHMPLCLLHFSTQVTDCLLLSLLRYRDLQVHWDQQFFCDTNHFGWCKFWFHIPWTLHRRALW